MTKFIDLPNEEIVYVGGMFPVGKLSCLVGNGGVGKSWTLLLASLAITDKRIFLPNDNYPLFDDKEVMVIDTENRTRSFYDRLIEADADPAKYYIPKDITDKIASTDTKDLELIEELCQDDKTMLIIIDSLAGFNAGIDENSINAMISVKWLGYLAQKYKKAIVITHFLNKSEVIGRITTENMRGHSSIQQFVELIWAIDKERGSEKIKKLYQIKNNISELDEKVYKFKLTNAEAVFLDIPNDQENEIEKRIKIYEANIDKDDKEVALLIQELEPHQQLVNLISWVKRRRNKK